MYQWIIIPHVQSFLQIFLYIHIEKINRISHKPRHGWNKLSWIHMFYNVHIQSVLSSFCIFSGSVSRGAKNFRMSCNYNCIILCSRNIISTPCWNFKYLFKLLFVSRKTIMYLCLKICDRLITSCVLLPRNSGYNNTFSKFISTLFSIFCYSYSNFWTCFIYWSL